MSRTGTATPPAPYFPQKVATPSVRHSAPNTANHHNKHSGHHNKRSRKHAAGPNQKAKSAGLPEHSQMDMSFEDISIPSFVDSSLYSNLNQSTTSFTTFQSTQSMPGMDHDVTTGSYLAVPDPSYFYTALSANSTPLVTPNQSSTSLSPLSVVSIDDEVNASPPVELLNRPIPAGRASWTSNFGKMAKAVVHTGKSMSMSFGDRKRKDAVSSDPVVISLPPVGEDAGLQRVASLQDEPTKSALASQEETGHHLSSFCNGQLLPNGVSIDRRNMSVAEHQRIVECARLCSQWPESGYQKSKFGPHGQSTSITSYRAYSPGAKAYYEPASFANPQWVRNIMQRQAELEANIVQNCASHFMCRRNFEESYSDDGTDQSVDSYMSSRASPTSSVQFEAEQKTIAAMKAAMEEQIINVPPPVDFAAGDSTAPKRAIRGARSISELDSLATSMKLSTATDDQAMDLDRSETRSLMSDTSRHERAASAGSKRVMQPIGPEEEKRRKVDEAMVVEEAVSTGVIMPSPPPKTDTCQNRQLSSSTPDLSAAKSSSGPAIFGHVVKTSDTHPIIISPFFPSEMLSILAANLVQPPTSLDGKVLSSKVDVAAALLAHTPNSSASSSAVSSPIVSTFRPDFHCKKLGNLLLSSCPGKRLRMEGPVKGRPPVCRDLETDLRRIKSEGVGCLVCCLDDTELALLGVPWETYHCIATKIGLDVIRMPMPDGLTPVSMSLFDSHVGLICQKYTLEGINVLVHCRGGVGRAGLTASAWAIKMGYVPPHPSLQIVADASKDKSEALPSELEHQVVMSMVERVIAMIRCRRGLKAIESFEQVHFLVAYVAWLRGKSLGQ